MRPRYQEGSLDKLNGKWRLRYYEDRVDGGKQVRVRRTRYIGSVSEFPRDTDARKEADRLLTESAVNLVGGSADGTTTLGEFIERSYFPRLDQRLNIVGELHLEPSTLKGYKDIWKFHIKNSRIASVRVRDFRTVDGQGFLETLSQKLSHKTHLRIKAFLSGVFNWAKQSGVLSGTNPMDDTKAGGAESSFDGYAYDHAEIRFMWEKLADPARTVCMVAAFTGLRASELRGLRWQDYDGKSLTVNQKVWGRHVGFPKTKESKASVPVVAPLQKILGDYRKSYPPVESGFMFYGEKKQFALDLNNLSRREIAVPLCGGWHGWHGFRRGLATRLVALGVDASTVQTIMRHADVSVTLGYYVKPTTSQKHAAMNQEAAGFWGHFGVKRKKRQKRKKRNSR